MKTRYAKDAFTKAGFEVTFDGAHFNEIVVNLKAPVKKVNQYLFENDIIGGYDLGLKFETLKNHALIAITEQRTKEEIDALVQHTTAVVQETEALNA